MTINKRLATAPITITPALSDFVFTVTPTQWHHFPARQWTNAQFLTMLQEKLGANYTLMLWHDMICAINQSQTQAIILPKFTKIEALNE